MPKVKTKYGNNSGTAKTSDEKGDNSKLKGKARVSISEEVLDIVRRADRLLGVPSIRYEAGKN